MIRAVRVATTSDQPAFDTIELDHGDRHLRRKMLTTSSGATVLVDLPEPAHLKHGQRLVLEDGRELAVAASSEALIEARPSPARSLAALAWHIGNRHLPAQIELDRILIARDHVIRDMLLGLGAGVREVTEPFEPEHGAYHGGHSHDHRSDRPHRHEHKH